MKPIGRNPPATNTLPLFVAVFALLPLPAPAPADTNKPPVQSSIPYVPTRHDAVRDLLWLADVGKNDVVYDLGSGDGRVVIAAVRDFHARKAVGIELKPELIHESRQNAAKAGVARRVQFIERDLFLSDFSEASVVVLYLGHGANLDLRTRLVRTLKPGARIVAHQFGMGEWPPDKTLVVRTPILGMYGEMVNEFRNNAEVPDYVNIPGPPMHDALAAWIVPAPVAGVWRGKVRLGSGEGDLTVNLHQLMSALSGSFQFLGPTNVDGFLQADLWGDHLRLHCIRNNNPYGAFLMWFDGHVKGDSMDGSLWISRDRQTQELQWTGHRDKADFAGTWEWTGAMDSPVQLKIERRDGRWAATYTDPNRKAPVWAGGNQPMPVTDFYDFGGGFYFRELPKTPTYAD